MSEAGSGEADGSTHGSLPTEGEIPLGNLLPLNSRRLTIQLKKIAEGLGLPTTGLKLGSSLKESLRRDMMFITYRW